MLLPATAPEPNGNVEEENVVVNDVDVSSADLSTTVKEWHEVLKAGYRVYVRGVQSSVQRLLYL